MDRVLILLAGLPGTGKTYLSNILINSLGPFHMLSQDSLKEYYSDLYGYNNLEEKQEVEKIAWVKYYELMEKQMKGEKNIISDYPFSQKQKPNIQKLVEEYGYKVLTIRLIGDLDILFERQKKRDLDPSRHLSHIVTSYKKGRYLADRGKADHLLTYEEFIKRCTTRGYDTFKLGKLYEVDVTDYTKVNYSKLLEDIKLWNENDCAEN
ncbi:MULTISPECIES: AAA family ATPase [unclassified Paenibacillus]|uniref:AAA family ATPase n=1 Tax=unclassified Paenibacillus TaxID=185978 RepID=UPI000C9F0096|nr:MULTISPECIES: AAA family ATPase [unclassified Paenibacillus]KAF6628663.1 AAA family ATPase [Paenibacillus sp. EKM208P]MBE0337112.1 kinase [Paenibacillus sp. 23TSA30-6]PNQ79332.1 kinase [Paenibacillus sp. F4]